MTRILAFFVAVVATPILLLATTITGSVSSTTGMPLRIAHVHLADAAGKPSVSTSVKKNGTYSFSSALQGLYYLTFTGTDHRMVSQRLLLHGQASVSADAVLTTNATSKDVDSVFITGDFNAFESMLQMKKNGNGTYTYEIPWSKPTIRYQVQFYLKGSTTVLLREMHTVNGTQFDAVQYDSGGDYRSIVKVKGGTATITFDPALMLTSAVKSGSVTIRSEADKKTAAYLAATAEIMAKLSGAFRVAQRDPVKLNALQDTVHARIASALAEKIDPADQELRDLRTMRVLSLAEAANEHPEAERIAICSLFTSMKPSSPAWSVSPTSIGQGISVCDGSNNDYYNKVLATNTSNGVRPVALYSMIEAAAEKNDNATVRKLYAQLLKGYPTHWTSDRARKEYSPDKKILVGKQVPAFSYVSLDDARVTFTKDTYKGKYVLIDLWATWCGPCVAEMPNLHKAYEKFKGPDFEVLSLSMDQDKERIKPFRQKWAMPWNHGFAPGVWQSQIAELFEASSIPKPILVGPDGKIIAITTGLRGADLEKTLSTYLKR